MFAVFRQPINRDQSRDTGMAMGLIMLLVFLYTRKPGYITAAILLHVINMTVPVVFKPVAVVWLGVSHLIGMVVSKIILSVVFFLVVVPVAALRNMMGKDALRLRGFKSQKQSVMVVRNHRFTADDLRRPF